MNLEQQRTVDALWVKDRGLCVCGAVIERMHPKMVFSQINTSWCVLESVRNTLAIGIYCGKCSDIICMTLKNLKPLPEPDKLKRQTFSGS